MAGGRVHRVLPPDFRNLGGCGMVYHARLHERQARAAIALRAVGVGGRARFNQGQMFSGIVLKEVSTKLCYY